MRFPRLFGVLGAAAVLGATLLPVAPAAQAAPLDSPREFTVERSWYRYGRPHWDSSQSWYQTRLALQPTAALAQPLTVRVVVAQPYAQSFALPTFVNVVQQNVLPALVQVVPQQYFVQTPPRFVQVQPNFWAVTHPSLYWGADDAWQAYQYAAWLSTQGLNFQPYAFNGPQGYGTYLAFQSGYQNGWGY